MTTYILHNDHDALSRAFVATHGAACIVIDWYATDAAGVALRAQYLAAGNPHPSAFPSVVETGVIVRQPATLAAAVDQIQAASNLR